MSSWKIHRPYLPYLLAQAVVLISMAATVGVADEVPSFNRDIRPILSNKCFACHGFDAKKREANLRLDTPEGAVAEQDGRRAIVPGDLGKSGLWKRITSDDPDHVMPPVKAKKPLTDAERNLLKRWIEAGAPFQKHWALEPIQNAEIGKQSRQNPIDTFLDARLKVSGMAVQPEADRETLVRRVAFALTGLPPTIAEVDEFLNDKSAKAYERMVDRFLKSLRYGEEMARHWLDVARYADTHGLHLDNERQMWAYRDWVVKALNDNLSFDQFTIWQLAGDLLPNPTTEQLVATGFNRCNVTTSEGGAIPDEWVYRYAVERTTATAQVWLGLTAGCAVCHDHKFDPLTSREFYSLYSFFHSAADPAMDGNINVTVPFMKLPTARHKAISEAAGKAEREVFAWLQAVAAQTEYVDPADSKDPQPRKPIRHVLFDEAFGPGVTTKSSSRNALALAVDPVYKTSSGRRTIRQAFASNYTDTIEFKLSPPVVPHDAILEVSVRVDPLEVPKSMSVGIVGAKTVTWTKNETGEPVGVSPRTTSVETTSIGTTTLVRGLTPAGSPSQTSAGSPSQVVVPGDWIKLAIAAADLGLKPGDRINGLTLNQNGGIVDWDLIVLTGNADPATDPLESLTAWRKMHGKTVPPDLPGELNPLIQAGPDNKLSDAGLAKLRTFYLSQIVRPADAELAAARSAWEAARTAKIIADETAPGTFIFRDLDKPRESFVMLRGQYDKPGDKVEPAIPAALPQITKLTPDTRLNRLDLAKWLIAPENPLTARVTVNRLWQQIFGTGLVKTSFDFGSQGDPPSHPELLDWLAADFRDNAWDVKRFVKQMMMSAAFRRSSRLTPDVRTADPHNRLYARGPRFRLDAEQVRDNVLFVSGLIDLTQGGRGVNPYQPPNIWEPVGYSDSNTRFFQQSHGAALYRRSLYVFLKRTAPPPFMSNFDGPNREQVCTVRERSNTPLQALQLMNDIQHFEAARALAERTLAEGGSTDESRIAWLYRSVLSRPPDPDELRLVAAALAKQRDFFKADPEAAAKAIGVGESKPKNIAPADETAAWTMIANLILNTDETVNRN